MKHAPFARIAYWQPRAALALSAALTLAVTQDARATNGMRLPGFGPVQSSMGGVGVGATLDSASVITNPAGVVDLDRRLDVGVSWFRPIVSYSASESPLPAGYTGAVVAHPGETFTSKRGGTPIPFLGGVLPITPRLKVGLALAGIAGMGVDYGTNLYGGRTYSSYLQARLAPAIAWRPNDLFAVGIALNAMAAQAAYDVAAGFGQQPHDTATALGIGATLGVKVTPGHGVSLGAAYETRSSFQDFTYDIRAHTGVNPVTFQPVPGISAGKDKLSFDQPQVATVGIAFSPIDALLVAGDLEFIDWPSTNGKNQPEYSSNSNATGALPLDLDWRQQWVFKLGTQVVVTPALRVRAGWNYGNSPLRAGRALENIVFPAIAEHHLTAGVGYDFSPSFTLNIGGSYAPEVSLSGSNPSYPAQGGQAIASYTTRMSQWTIDAGMSWRL